MGAAIECANGNRGAQFRIVLPTQGSV
jgi:hypothetical protein